MPDLRTVFAGSPEFAASVLSHLAASSFAPVAVYTQPDRAKGRGRKVRANAVKTLAQKLDLPIEQPVSLRDTSAKASLASYAPDLLIVAAYGLILPQDVLDIPTYGCINVHASLLPRWRGAAPIERAIMAGDEQTGVCIMHMEAGLDTGPVYRNQSIAIETPADPLEIERKLANQGSQLLIEVLGEFADAKLGEGAKPQAVPQLEALANYADKLTSADREIDWHASAAVIARQIQALSHRLPVRVTVNGCGVQLLGATFIEQQPLAEEIVTPGTLIDISKSGILIQCATDLLQITSLKVERGKGAVLNPAAAMNGFADLFTPGAKFTTR